MLKVWTVEWHRDYDGGSVEAVFDSSEKAQALLTKIQEEGKFYEELLYRFQGRMHKIKYAMGFRYGESVPYPHKWHDVWHSGCDRAFTCPHLCSYRDYSVFEYEVL